MRRLFLDSKQIKKMFLAEPSISMEQIVHQIKIVEKHSTPTMYFHFISTHTHRKEFTHRSPHTQSLVIGHLTLLFHIQPSPLKAGSTGRGEKKEVLIRICYFTITAVSGTVDCRLIIQGWQMETEKSVVRKKGHLFSQSEWGWAPRLRLTPCQTAVIQRSPWKRHKSPQKGTACRLSCR